MTRYPDTRIKDPRSAAPPWQNILACLTLFLLCAVIATGGLVITTYLDSVETRLSASTHRLAALETRCNGLEATLAILINPEGPQPTSLGPRSSTDPMFGSLQQRHSFLLGRR